MRTDRIHIDPQGSGIRQIMDEAEKFAEYSNFDKKDAMRLRLLCEEATEMLRHLAGEFNALVWIEDNLSGETNIVLEIRTDMDKEKRARFLNVSSTGKNMNSKGIIGKLRDIVEFALMEENVRERMTDYDFLQMGASDEEKNEEEMTDFDIWSPSQYKGAVDGFRSESDRYEEAWDELEKSIIANLADDIRIGIRDKKVNMIISKKF